MAERFLVSVDIEHLEDTHEGGVDFKTISYLNRVYTIANPKNVDAVSLFLRQHFHECTTYVDVTALENLQDIIALLDHGATKVFVTYKQLQNIVEDSILGDLDRLVVSLDHSDCEGDPEEKVTEIKRSLSKLVGANHVGIRVHDVHEWKVLDAMEQYSRHGGFPARYVNLSNSTRDNYVRTVKGGHIPIVPAMALTADPSRYPNLIPPELLIITSISTDRPDKLYPTVVINERGVCLGLVYSNAQSIREALRTGRGVYKSRKSAGDQLWIKGQTSGDIQELVSISWDCDGDALRFTVRQKGDGFCHLKTSTCFGPYTGLSKLEQTLKARKASAMTGSYTARLYSDPPLLKRKIMEEARELCDAEEKEHIAAEAADLLYFAMTRCIATGISLEDVEHNLDLKAMKTTRRPGNAKPEWMKEFVMANGRCGFKQRTVDRDEEIVEEAASIPKISESAAGSQNRRIQMRQYKTSETDAAKLKDVLQRPSQKSTDSIMSIVKPIIEKVRTAGDAAVLEYTHKFEKATSLTSPVLRAPFPERLMQLSQETIKAIDISFDNIHRFHAAQRENKPLKVETMPGVMCSRFSKAIEKVGLYVPGGTAVLPSTALMLGIPAMVAGCKTIVLATPPRSDGSITPEVVYVAHKIGAQSIVLAGGAQAVAAMAYGTESITKVDKILGPGNQFVTAAKMLVSNDTSACVSYDMPAGPSEVLVIADRTANPAFVASDLLSQAEHGLDSQVILIAVDLNEEQLEAIDDELHTQANALPRVDIVRGAIEHSVTLVVNDIDEAMRYSNQYAPEHLILQTKDPEKVLEMVEHAGSVFVGQWSPESVGDYSAGVNHSLPTYGYAKQYSGVNLASFTKHITSSTLTKEGLKNVGGAVMQLAKVEELEAHRRAGPSDLTVTSLPTPTPSPTQYLIAIHATATNFFDLLQIRGKYQHQPPLPWISGSEFAGVVLSSPSPSSTFRPGDHVFGAAQGGYATHVCAEEGRLRRVPKGWGFVEAAGLMVTAPTAYAALVTRAGVKRGDVVLVHAAAGGVGLAAVQVAKALGATVIATAGSARKLEVARSYGADYGVDYNERGWEEVVKGLTPGAKGVGIVFDPLGMVETSLRCTRWNGRIVVIGFAAGKIEKVAMNRVLLKNVSLVGLHWGMYAKEEVETVEVVWRGLEGLMAEGKFRGTVYTDRDFVGLEAVGEALGMLGRRETWGKVVVKVPQEGESKL